MIERTTVNGLLATVAYLKNDFTPSDEASADLAKVVFDDGHIVFLVMREPKSDKRS